LAGDDVGGCGVRLGPVSLRLGAVVVFGLLALLGLSLSMYSVVYTRVKLSS
jgi:hypothetical protein